MFCFWRTETVASRRFMNWTINWLFCWHLLMDWLEYLLAWWWMLIWLSFLSFASNESAVLFKSHLICTRRTRKQPLQLVMSCGVVVVRDTGAIFGFCTFIICNLMEIRKLFVRTLFRFFSVSIFYVLMMNLLRALYTITNSSLSLHTRITTWDWPNQPNEAHTPDIWEKN